VFCIGYFLIFLSLSHEWWLI